MTDYDMDVFIVFVGLLFSYPVLARGKVFLVVVDVSAIMT